MSKARKEGVRKPEMSVSVPKVTIIAYSLN